MFFVGLVNLLMNSFVNLLMELAIACLIDADLILVGLSVEMFAN